MRTFLLSTMVATASAAAFLAVAPLANAGPNDMPCTLSFAPLCSMIPALPNLDHDIDLTQDPNALDSAATAPAPPAPQPEG